MKPSFIDTLSGLFVLLFHEAKIQEILGDENDPSFAPFLFSRLQHYSQSEVVWENAK